MCVRVCLRAHKRVSRYAHNIFYLYKFQFTFLALSATTGTSCRSSSTISSLPVRTFYVSRAPPGIHARTRTQKEAQMRKRHRLVEITDNIRDRMNAQIGGCSAWMYRRNDRISPAAGSPWIPPEGPRSRGLHPT